MALCLGGCAPAPPTPLRVAMSPWPGYEFLYLAQQRGFFREEGVEVRLVELESPGDSRAAFENGSVDAFAASNVELVFSHAQARRRPQAFFVLDWSAGGDVLLGDSTVHAITDLRGRRVALEAGSVDVLNIWAALASAGLRLTDVELAPMPQNEKDYAFERGGVQAVQCFPPISLELLEHRGVHRLFDSAQAPGLVADVLVADSAALADDATRYRAVVRAVLRAEDWAREHPDEARDVMADREQLAPEAFADGMAGLRLVSLAEQRPNLAPGGPFERALARTWDVLVEIGALAPPVRGGALVTTQALPDSGS
ncbi:MAG: ABC transporter substrate-binding protein [Candidatus Eisenbacteria bacterium]